MVELPESKVQFVVGLSNGENLIEGKGILSFVAGEDSPWHKLQKYLKENNLAITSMSLSSKTEIGNRHYNLPNQKSKFNSQAPLGFNCFRWVALEGSAMQNIAEQYSVAEAIYPKFKVQLWVSEQDPDKCWIAIKEV